MSLPFLSSNNSNDFDLFECLNYNPTNYDSDSEDEFVKSFIENLNNESLHEDYEHSLKRKTEDNDESRQSPFVKKAAYGTNVVESEDLQASSYVPIVFTPTSRKLLEESELIFMFEGKNVTSEEKADAYILLELFVNTVTERSQHSFEDVAKYLLYFLAWTSAFEVSRKAGTYVTYMKKEGRKSGIPHMFLRKRGDPRIKWKLDSSKNILRFLKDNFTNARNFSVKDAVDNRGGFSKQFERLRRYYYVMTESMEEILSENNEMLNTCLNAFEKLDLKCDMNFEEFAQDMTAMYIRITLNSVGLNCLAEDVINLQTDENLLRGVRNFEDFKGPITTIASYVASCVTALAKKNRVDVNALSDIFKSIGVDTDTYSPQEFFVLHKEKENNDDVPPPPPILEKSEMKKQIKIGLNNIAERLFAGQYGLTRGLVKDAFCKTKQILGKVHDCATSEMFIESNKEEIERIFFKSSKTSYSCRSCGSTINVLVTHSPLGGTKEQTRLPYFKTFYSKCVLKHLMSKC